jgi:hypothetical protein
MHVRSSVNASPLLPRRTTMMYDAPMQSALALSAHDLLGDVRIACEMRAAQERPVATIKMSTNRA